MSRRISKTIGIVLALVCFMEAGARAKELDPFTDRLLVLRYYAGGYRSIRGAPGPARIDAVLDARMNELLDQLERDLRRTRPQTIAERERSVGRVFQHPFVPELVTPYEEWIKHDAHVPLYKVRDKGIYGHGVDYDDVRMTWYIELSPILQVSGVVIGLDKLGHFLAQGYGYHVRYSELTRVPEALRLAALRELGHETELRQLGLATGGVYSFADLAANWAGFIFFSALFDDVDVEGDKHSRYFIANGDGTYRRVRDFHWSEWIRPDWDEALNPAAVAERELYDKIVTNMQRRPGPLGSRRPSICDNYVVSPVAYLGARRTLRDRSRYALPERARSAARYAIDVRTICGPVHSAMPKPST